MPSAGRRRGASRSGSTCVATAACPQTGPGGAARSYRYDPRRPIPTLGGRNMLIDAGPRDQRPAQALPDYGLIYRGEAAGGRISRSPARCASRCTSQSDCPDTDFIAKLIEVAARRPRHAADGWRGARDVPRCGRPTPQPLEPGRVYRLTIEPRAHPPHDARGHRIEVDVTSSNFPRRARNTNSGNPLLANDGEADIRVARNTVHHAEATPSFVEIPVLGKEMQET